MRDKIERRLAAFEQVRDKIDSQFVDIGEQSLKNMKRTIRAYSIVGDNQNTRAGRVRALTDVLRFTRNSRI